MARGKKINLFLNDDFEDGWVVVEDKNDNEKNHIIKENQHKLVFKKEKRKGKPVTLVGEFFLEKQEAQKLLKELKSSLACGGSFKNGFMEFQGDIKEKIKQLLLNKGFRFKNNS